MTAPVILVVEDDPGLRVLIARALQQNGFAVSQAGSGPEMWGIFEKRPVDLILLDIMLPGKNGIDLCREIRARSPVPIIFISAKGDETDRVVGLELGADDYLAKPVGTRELIARVRAVLRRGQLGCGPDNVRNEKARFAGWEVDLRRRAVFSPSGARWTSRRPSACRTIAHVAPRGALAARATTPVPIPARTTAGAIVTARRSDCRTVR